MTASHYLPPKQRWYRQGLITTILFVFTMGLSTMLGAARR